MPAGRYANLFSILPDAAGADAQAIDALDVAAGQGGAVDGGLQAASFSLGHLTMAPLALEMHQDAVPIPYF